MYTSNPLSVAVERVEIVKKARNTCGFEHRLATNELARSGVFILEQFGLNWKCVCVCALDICRLLCDTASMSAE